MAARGRLQRRSIDPASTVAAATACGGGRSAHSLLPPLTRTLLMPSTLRACARTRTRRGVFCEAPLVLMMAYLRIALPLSLLCMTPLYREKARLLRKMFTARLKGVSTRSN